MTKEWINWNEKVKRAIYPITEVQESVLSDDSRVPDNIHENDVVKMSNDSYGYEAFDQNSSPDLQDDKLSKPAHKNKKFSKKESAIAPIPENTEKVEKKGFYFHSG